MTSEPADDAKIAIIGLAGRFPGATDVRRYWSNLTAGIESIITLDEQDLAAAGVPPLILHDPAYVRRAAPIEGIEEFDAEFFELTPAAARMTDPQQRLFLQTSWWALEDAGYAPRSAGRVGVFGSTGTSSYLINNVLPHYDLDATFRSGANMAMVSLAFANDKDYIATRVSHALDLTGPSVAVQSACSSSLLAVHLAIQSLLVGDCDVALAGGVSVRVPQRAGYLYEPGSIVSPDGRCRAFDAAADGTVFGSGVGVVVLKPLPAALADGDPIRAVVRGSAVNNDGSRKMGFSAPSVTMQAEVVAEAMVVAGVRPDDVGYVEAHGTGTPLGDPVEVRALAAAFEGRAGDRPCVLGSVKPNVGHLESASGIAGLIKTVLALQHRTLPATLHYRRPNPELQLARTPFEIRPDTVPWAGPGRRVAGVSSLGVGGTNVHVVLEEAPPRPRRAATTGPRVLLLSARTPQALDRLRRSLAGHLREQGADQDLTDVAHTLAVGRTPMRCRLVAVGDAGSVPDALDGPGRPGTLTASQVDGGPDRVAFLFPGQGVQYPAMTAGLYRRLPGFRREVDELAARFGDHLRLDLRAVLLGDDDEALRRTELAQPALFTVGLALARALGDHGLAPGVLAGHSVGEYVAATLAGLWTVDDAVALVAERGRLMAATGPGAMLWVRAPAAEIEPLLTGSGLSLAAVNEPGSCVVSGPAGAIEAFQERTAGTGRTVRRLNTSHGFHSSLMNPLLAEFEAVAARVPARAPRTALTSNTTGGWMTAQEAADPSRWADQIRSTVRFSDNLDALLTDPGRVLVELGPGRTLITAARRHPRWSSTHRAVQLVRQGQEDGDDLERFLLGVGGCWAAGLDVSWPPDPGLPSPRRVTLPGYPFEPARHWMAPGPRLGPGPAAEPDAGHTGHTGHTGHAGRPDHDAAEGAVDDLEPGTEAVLGRICRDLLGLPRVARHDNFFDLGGDSVVAVQVAAAAAREGLRLTPRDLFEYQSIAALAAFLGAPGGPDGPDGPGGPDGPEQVTALRVADVDHPEPPITPGQWRVLREADGPVAGWRVPLLLELAPRARPAAVAAALHAVVAHHEVLRLQLTGGPDLPRQSVRSAPPEPEPLPEMSPAPGEPVSELLARLGADPAGADPAGSGAEVGRAVLAALVRDERAGRSWLALSVHHFAVDNASYEILLADLDLALRQTLDGEAVRLPPVPTPWRRWAAALSTLAGHPQILAERSHWLAPQPADLTRLAAEPSAAGSRRVERLPAALTAASTERVLAVQRDRRQRIEDLLLPVLAQVVTEVGDGAAVLVDVEGSGREAGLDGVDLSRTIGWLTTIYPVLVEPGRATAPAPRQGLGHDLLRELHAPSAAVLRRRPRAEILLAWLGVLPDAPPGSGLVVPDLDRVLPAGLTPPGLGHPLELRAYLWRGLLHLDWWVDRGRIGEGVAEALRDGMLAAVAEVGRPRELVTLDADEADDLLAELAGAEES